MRRVIGCIVYVIAVLAFHQGIQAQDAAGSPPPVPEEVPSGFVPSRNVLQKFAPKRTGDSQLPTGAFNGWLWKRPGTDLGAPGSSGEGFQHFSSPLHRYSMWYLPRASTLNTQQRCEPEDFRPRGYANLFATPADCYRMDYQPYSLGDGMSTYGPAYVRRAGDLRCKADCLIEVE